MLKRLLPLLLISAPTFAAVSYTDWTSATVSPTGSAAGSITLPDASVVTVSYTGDVGPATQISGGINYYDPFTPFQNSVVTAPPPNNDIISLIGGSTLPVNTLTFSQAVTDPVLLIVSLGRSNLEVDYDFNAPFDVLSFGPGYWGGPGTLNELAGDILQGFEGHGAIQFKGSFTSISWTATEENWHGFTVALPDQNPTVPDGLGFAPVLGTVLSVFAAARAKNRKS